MSSTIWKFLLFIITPLGPLERQECLCSMLVGAHKFMSFLQGANSFQCVFQPCQTYRTLAVFYHIGVGGAIAKWVRGATSHHPIECTWDFQTVIV